MKRNIELKAKCRDLAFARDAALRTGARAEGILMQTDTYFHVPHGRLKLREIAGQRAELIWYARSNQTAFRASDYVVSPVADVPTMLTALMSALRIRGTVKKRRELLLYENVRIHLDSVDTLGSFLEFEAVVSDQHNEQISHQRLATLTEALQIADTDRIAVSYSDLAGL
ncbi:MAG TPA: class IV adenylate cyclase [Tepidisphaeraceae bacterium]|jgi:predicted adenylyl cyclase CyaB